MGKRLAQRVEIAIAKHTHWAVVLICALWLSSSSLVAQVTEFPRQTPKNPEATSEAGIGSYRITKQGEVFEVDAFDVEDGLLASCTVEWFESSKVMVCEMADGRRFRSTWYERHAKFEELSSGEHFILRFKGQPGRVRDPDATAQERGWVVEGNKSWSEVEREWGDVTPIFGHLMGEMEVTLGLVFKSLTKVRDDRKERGTH